MPTKHHAGVRRPGQVSWFIRAMLTIAVAVSAGSVTAQNTQWTNTVLGNWFIGSNWTNGVPVGNQSAFINNGGTAFINSPGAVSWSLDIAGQFGGGTLLISNGGTLRQFNGAGIGTANFTASVTVSGNNSRWDVDHRLSVFDNGTLRIENGADVQSLLGRISGSGTASASATITGVGSTWTTTGLPFTVSSFDIGDFGTGSLTISNGGTLTNSLAASLGGHTGSSGTATVTGAGSFWNNGGYIYVGADLSGGAGALRISDLGVVQAGALRVSNTGLVEVNNGQSTVAGLILIGGAREFAIEGTLGSLIIANDSSGRMIVINGGAASSSLGVVGRGAGHTGTVTVDGSGSRWTNSGDIVVGESGAGTLEIRAGGAVSNHRGHVGFNTGASGTVIVRDPGSTWTGAGSFFIGNGGVGGLQVRDGGVASTAGNSYLGFSPGSAGSATVSGAGSTWNTAVTLIIGGNFNGPGGQGVLRIENGGTVNTGSTILYDTGVVELVGATTFSGPLSSRGGLVRTFGDTALTNDITLESGGLNIVNFTPGSTATFSGAISGSGGLTKSGLAADTTLRLTGNNTYTGATTINSGRLVVDGSITSALILANGATLNGSGSVGAVTIKNGGVVAPGNSPGLLTAGDTTFESGGAYLLDLRSDGTGVAGTDWDSLAVNTLDTSALSEANPFIFRLQTLDASNGLNYLEVWDRNVSHTWDSVLTSVALGGGDFDPRHIQVDTSGFQNTISGKFTVVQAGTNLNLQYDADVVDESILVSNLTQPLRGATPIGNNPNPVDPPEGPGQPWYWGAQSFESDNQQYSLTSIEAIVGDGSTASVPIVVAELHADSAGTIGELITTFTAPDMSGPASARTFLPDSAVTLDANTAYWFVLGSENPGGGTYFWQYAEGDDFVGLGSLTAFADTTESGINWSYSAANPYFLQVNVAAVAGLLGDYNQNGAVDAADYVVWRKNLGSDTALPNDDTSGVGDDDYTRWRANFGRTGGSGAGTTAGLPSRAVPEPGAVLLFALAAPMLSLSRRRSEAINAADRGQE